MSNHKPLRLGQVMLDIEGIALTPEDREILQHPNTGGVILFSRNYQDINQLQTLISDIKSVRTQPLLIAIDQEGGRVQRLREGFTELPKMQRLGHCYTSNPQQGLDLARTCGWLMAAEVLAVGIDFSFAPVLDIDSGISAVIGDRSFSSDPDVVTSLAQAFIQGMNAAGMAATGKHFPGHGSVAADSHHALPVDERDIESIENWDLQPFKPLIESGSLAGIMPAHVLYKQVDSLPAGFSKIWLQDILRQRLNFQGAIFSDDLCMVGANHLGTYAERAQLALQAGCDMVLVCNQRSAAINVLEGLTQQPIAELAEQRLQRLYGSKRLAWTELNKDKTWQHAAATIAAING